MKTTVQRNRNILIAVDESDNAKRAVSYVKDFLLESRKGYLEEKKREMQLDKELALKVVHEFKNSQFQPKAKLHPQQNIFAQLC